MDEITRVAVDAMGGDNAPEEIVKGAVEAVNENHKIKVYLVGKQVAVQEELNSWIRRILLYWQFVRKRSRQLLRHCIW